MRSLWVLALASCGGKGPAPITNATPSPVEDLRGAIVRELGKSAYLMAGASGLVVRNERDGHRVLVGKPVNAAAYDASLDLVFFTMQGEAGVWSLDLRARTAEPEVIVDGTGNGDFAIAWFDGRGITTNTAAVNISIDLKTGEVGSTRSANEGPVDDAWATRMRSRTRRALPAPVALADGASIALGKTGLKLAASEAGVVLRRGDRATSIHTPTTWLAADSDELDVTCEIVELDATEQRWFAFGTVCSTSGCTLTREDDRPIAWIEPGPVVRPACAGGDDP